MLLLLPRPQQPGLTQPSSDTAGWGLLPGPLGKSQPYNHKHQLTAPKHCGEPPTPPGSPAHTAGLSKALIGVTSKDSKFKALPEDVGLRGPKQKSFLPAPISGLCHGWGTCARGQVAAYGKAEPEGQVRQFRVQRGARRAPPGTEVPHGET